MDFVVNQLSNGMKLRTLTIVDVFSKEFLAIEVGQTLTDKHVAQMLNQLIAQCGALKYIFVDNGSECSGRLMDLWAYHYGVRIDFSRPRKPADNGHIETFNGFNASAEAKVIIESWRGDHNECRPPSACNDMTSVVFAGRARNSVLTQENLTPGINS